MPPPLARLVLRSTRPSRRASSAWTSSLGRTAPTTASESCSISPGWRPCWRCGPGTWRSGRRRCGDLSGAPAMCPPPHTRWVLRTNPVSSCHLS
eukprot:5433356-Pyramimonas_sp.AAC.1